MSIEKLLEECENLFEESKYPEVIAVCNEILEMEPDNESTLGYKARSLYFMDEFEEALELLNIAVVLYPNNYNFTYFKGEVLMDMGEYDKAIECFDEVSADETNLRFIKSDCSTLFGIKIDDLIEREKYVDAWECFNLKLEIDSDNLKRSEAIKRFKTYIQEYTTRGKRRKYHVRISSPEAKSDLINFLKENGFKGIDESGLLFLIDVVDKTFTAVSADENNSIISESKFLDKVNYYPRNKIQRKKIHDECGNLLYEGYTLHNAPYGFGVAYFENGNIYREGIFDIKGIAQGREYYPSGRLRFEGEWSLTTGYGPNAPYNGNAYNEDGELIYSGKFEIKRGGVGWPMIRKPEGFGPEQKKRPKLKYK